MLHIPKTQPNRYVSAIIALNIHSPEGTGDWHSEAALNSQNYRQELFTYGEGQPENTNHLLGSTGIIDGTRRLHEMGYYPENTPVWIAEHPRACVDYLYTAVVRAGNIDSIILEEWFPEDDDKQSVYDLISRIEPHLNSREKHNLELWKNKKTIA